MTKKDWYLETWFISLLFALSFLILPFIAGIALLIFHYMDEKKRKQKYLMIDDAEKYSAEVNRATDAVRTEIMELKNEKTNLEQKLADYFKEVTQQKNKLQNELDLYTKEILVQATNIEVDENISSEEYKNKLSMLRLKQSELIKQDGALNIESSDSKKMLNNNMKQLLRCFNSESELIISSTTVKNIDTCRNKMHRTYEALNKIFITDGISITHELLELKLEELNLVYSYQLRQEQEREEQKAIKEQMVEEDKVRREIEKEKQKIEKEETQFKNEVSKLMSYLNAATDDIQKNLYVDKIRELEEKLKLLEKDKENVLQREQNTRAGFVYIISNIGSFGENVYKIGMTRRLEPMDRVKELGDASVPFEFDVHAMIFSEDAPTLENILHNTFRNNQINKINIRKEFFKVSLSEIENVVKTNHNATVEFTQLAKAEQYRASLAMG